MAFWDKLKKKKEPTEEFPAKQEPSGEPAADTMVSILFDRERIDTKEFETVIIENFGQEALVQVDASHPSVTHFVVRLDEAEFWCSYMPFPLPKEEADIPALLNDNHFISVEEQQALVSQKSFFLIAQKGGGKTLEGKRAICLRISQLCGALMGVDGAAGFFYNSTGLLLGKEMYLKHTAILGQEKGNPDYFPSMLWILVYPSRAEDGSPTIETRGLEQFGFMELQFYKPKEDWAQSYEKLYIMSLLQITGKELYKNRDTISFIEDGFSIFKQSGNKLSVIGGI